MSITMTTEKIMEMIDTQNHAVKSQAGTISKQDEENIILKKQNQELISQVKYLTFLLDLKPAEIKEFVETYLTLKIGEKEERAFCDNKQALAQAQIHMKYLMPYMEEFQNKLYHRSFMKVHTVRNKKRKTTHDAADVQTGTA